MTSILSRPIVPNTPLHNTPPLYKWLCDFFNVILAKVSCIINVVLL